MRSIDPTLILLTPGEAARRLSVSLRVLKSRIEAKQFPPPRRIGRSVRFLAADVEAYARGLPIADLDWRELMKDGEGYAKASALKSQDTGENSNMDTTVRALSPLHKIWAKREPESVIHPRRMDPNDPARLP